MHSPTPNLGPSAWDAQVRACPGASTHIGTLLQDTHVYVISCWAYTCKHTTSTYTHVHSCPLFCRAGGAG